LFLIFGIFNNSQFLTFIVFILTSILYLIIQLIIYLELSSFIVHWFMFRINPCVKFTYWCMLFLFVFPLWISLRKWKKKRKVNVLIIEITYNYESIEYEVETYIHPLNSLNSFNFNNSLVLKFIEFIFSYW